MLSTHSLLQSISWTIAICSAILTGIFGATFGGDSYFLIAVFFLVFALISALCPILTNTFFSTLLRANYARAVILAPFALFFVFTDLITNGGTAALFRQADLVRTDNQNTKAKDARNEVQRLERRAAEIRATTAWKGAWQSPAAYDDMIAAARLIRDNEERRGGCGPICEKKTLEVAELTAAKANALQREALKKELLNIEGELRAAKAASAETPTRASAALTHAQNVAAGITWQVDPDDKSTFWANYGLSLWSGVAVTFASMAAAILLAFSGAMRVVEGHQVQPQRQPWESRPLADMRPEAAASTAQGQTIVLQSHEDHTDDSLSLLMEAVERINRKYAI